MMYNFNHLYYFYTAAQFKSITKASEFLKISQPSLSSQIKALEESLGLVLFKRNGRSVELTEKGEIIFNACNEMFKNTSALSDLINGKDEKEVLLRIGVSGQIERPFITNIIGNLIRKNKNSQVPLIRMTSLDEGPISSSKYDLLVHHNEHVKNFHETVTLNFPVALIGQEKLLRKNGQNFRSIRAFFKNYSGGIVLPTENFELRKETNHFFSKDQVFPKIVFESDNMAANIRAVTEGVGIGLFPINYAFKEIKAQNLDYFMPPRGLWDHHVFLHFNQNKQKQILMNRLINIFLEATHLKI